MRFKVGEIVWWRWCAHQPPIMVRMAAVGAIFHQIQGLGTPITAPASDSELEPLSALDRLAAEL